MNRQSKPAEPLEFTARPTDCKRTRRPGAVAARTGALYRRTFIPTTRKNRE